MRKTISLLAVLVVLLAIPASAHAFSSTTTTISCPKSTELGSLVACSSTVTGSGTLTGYLTISATGIPLAVVCPVLYTSNICNFSFIAFAKGHITVTASYSGDKANAPSSASARIIVHR